MTRRVIHRLTEISRKKSIVALCSFPPLLLKREKEEMGSNGLPRSCEQHDEPQIATGFGFCLSQHSHLTFGAPGCCAKMSITTFPTESSVMSLPLPRDSELRSE